MAGIAGYPLLWIHPANRENQRRNTIKTFIEAHRSSPAPFDIAAGGHSQGSDPIKARAHVEPYIEAGATWWIEFVLPDPGEGDQALTRIKQGPPK